MRIFKRQATIVICVCTLFFAAVAVLLYEHVTSSNRPDTNPITDGRPLNDPTFGFQYYQPMAIPEGFHVVDKRIDISDPEEGIIGISAELNLRKVDWVYAIRESRASAPYGAVSLKDIQTSLSNYDATSIKPTCRQMVSPQKQLYRLCHWIDYGSIDVNELKFIKGGTYIYTQFPGAVGNPVPLPSFDTYVDSFEKADANSFPILASGV